MEAPGETACASTPRRVVLNEAAEEREDRLSLAGLPKICDASKTFGLLAAAGVIKRRYDDHGNP